MKATDKHKAKRYDEILGRYTIEMKHCIETLDVKEIGKAANLILDAYKKRRTIFIFGNGGSASTSQHFACDLSKGTVLSQSNENEKRVRVVSIVDNIAIMTAYSNDISYDSVFKQQLQNLLEEGDLVIGISASGNSKNVIEAMKYAKKQGAKSIGILGFKTGGAVAEIVDSAIVVDSNNYGPVEDIHGMICHMIASVVAEQKKRNLSVPFSLEKH